MGVAADLVRRYLDSVWNAHNVDALDELCSPTYQRHIGPTGTPLDLAAQKQRLAGLFAAFPDMTATAEDVVEQDNRAAFRVTFDGTHLGAFRGVEPTGRSVHTQAVDIIAVTDGRISEHWGVFDFAGLLDQIT